MRPISVLLLLIGLPAVVSAQSEPPMAQVRYRAPEACPGFEVFQDLVTARLGYSPFSADAARSLSVRVDETEGEFVGVTENATASSEGVRGTECDEVVEALAMLLALEIDPLGIGSASPEPERAPLSSELESLSEEQPPPEETAEPPVPRETGPGLFGEVGVLLSLGIAPSLSLGGGVAVGLRWPEFEVSIGAELEATPVEGTVRGAEMTASVFRATAAPCFVAGLLRGCGLLQLGRIQIETDQLSPPNSGSALAGYAGARLALDFPGPGFGWSVAAQATVPFVRVDLVFGDQVAWTAPLFAAGITASIRFGSYRDGSSPEPTSSNDE